MPQNAAIPVRDSVIRQKRAVTGVVTLTHNDAPIAGQDVTVEQKKHAVLFGSGWGSTAIQHANGELTGESLALAEQRQARYVEIFNMATLPFYWGRFEPERGKPDTQRIMNTARWFRDQGCLCKGHPLCWHTLTAPWLLEMTPAEILKAQLARIERDVTGFAGVIDTWDVINEAVIMPVFDRYDNGITRLCKDMGRINLIRAVFEATRAANPNATLLINDFDVSSAYDILVEGCLEAGIQFDVIGIQSHMHQGYWGVEKTEWVLANFERFGLPIHFTENTIVSGHIMPPEIVDLNDYQIPEWPTTPAGEERQAEEVVTHYKTLMAHPLVQAVTWWDFEDGLWLGAPSGLLRKDMRSKPAYEALRGLIKGEWWLSPTRLTTDASGQFSVTGFPGDYAVTIAGKTVPFTLSQPGEIAVSI